MKLLKAFLGIVILITHPGRAQVTASQSFELLEFNRPVQINCLFQSHPGYIYLGTNSGLFKFNGESFTRLFFKNKDYTDTVTAITEDKSGLIWAGFKNGRLARLIQNQLQFINPEEGTPSVRISCMATDKNNNLWYAAYGEGLYYTQNNHHYLINAQNGLSDLNINSICQTGGSDMLIGTDQGLSIYHGQNKKVTNLTPANGLPDYIVTSIKPAGNNRYWIAFQDKGFCLFDLNTRKIILINAVQNWAYGQINDLIREGNHLFLATQQSGIIEFDIEKGTFNKNLSADFTVVQQLLKDPQGNIWFYGQNNKLSFTQKNYLKILPLYPENEFEKIHAVYCDKKGNIWLNTDASISRYSSLPGENYAAEKFVLPNFSHNTDITAIYQDAFENIWVGTMGQGIYVLNPGTKVIRHLNRNIKFSLASILSISGKGDSIFVCSLQGAAIITLNKNNGDIQQTYSFEELSNTLSGSHYLYSIFKDSKNRIWFASDGNGLAVQYPNGEKKVFGKKDGISDGHIYSVAEDQNHHIWFSTASNGVYTYNEKTFYNYNLKNGLSDLNISVVKNLGSGFIAIVNQKGVDLIHPQTGAITYLNTRKGSFHINTDNIGSASLDPQGRLVAAEKNGIIIYDVPRESSLAPITLIESIKLFTNEVDTTRQHEFAYDENNFSFSYTGLYFTNPSAVFYQYKLEGFDNDWVDTRDETLVFSKLQPGKYSFKVRSSLHKDFSGAPIASYSFVIRQAFYKTAWFITVCALLFCALLFWFVKNREKHIKKMQQLQQEKIQFQFEVLRNQVNPHFLFNSFNTLISTIEENPRVAVEYTEQLSDFFRNIVAYREKDIIPLVEELELLKTYYFLQQKRYGANLQLNMDINVAGAQHLFIPPLTLQLLLENAIKHNAISNERKLLVHFRLTPNNDLVVSNAKSSKKLLQPGAGMGLQNISNRFKLLTGKSIVIQQTSDLFTIELPLIKNG